MKPLFQQQCEALVKTLTKAKANEANTLYMYTWINDVQPCGTAACVCGYQALSNDLRLFKGAMKTVECSGDYYDIATAISDSIDISCEEFFGNDDLAMSIYVQTSHERLLYARRARFVDEETQTLLSFKHLTSDEPTIDAAIEYIEFVIEKCKEWVQLERAARPLILPSQTTQ